MALLAVVVLGQVAEDIAKEPVRSCGIDAGFRAPACVVDSNLDKKKWTVFRIGGRNSDQSRVFSLAVIRGSFYHLLRAASCQAHNVKGGEERVWLGGNVLLIDKHFDTRVQQSCILGSSLGALEKEKKNKGKR